MPKNIYVFETRNVNYLKPYVDKASSLGFNINVITDPQLENNKLFNQFISVYKHYSVNPPDFEIACFARYFAIAALLKNDEPFIMTDTDVFITKSFRELQGCDFKGQFVGSEGFKADGSEGQISPHCTIWNRELIMDFIQFVVDKYKLNNENDFLANYYKLRTEKYIHTAVSDMNLIYLWLKEKNVPYINSNSTTFGFGIDHNISELICDGGKFKSFANRKYLKKRGEKYSCILETGQEQDMALLHFQGLYKGTLKNFYLGKYARFIYYSLRKNYKHNKKVFKY